MNRDFWDPLQFLQMETEFIPRQGEFVFSHHPNFAVSDLWRHVEPENWKNLAPPWSPLRRFPPGKPAPRNISHSLVLEQWDAPPPQIPRACVRTTAIRISRSLPAKIMLLWTKAGKLGLGNDGEFTSFTVEFKKATSVSAAMIQERARHLTQAGRCKILVKSLLSLKSERDEHGDFPLSCLVRNIVQRNVALWCLWGGYAREKVLPEHIVREFSTIHCREVQGSAELQVLFLDNRILQRPSRAAHWRNARAANENRGKIPPQSGLISLPGFLGEFVISSLSYELAFHLALAEEWGIGSNTLYGFGRIEIQTQF